ncbi:hypothetical protein COO60DRAFT_84811 [Scenedesmus sp. NREL 46B-D3]|nr:hypothetical protein COO60DRAFT_84811 [Scenedesmus sp. NREL 46B-D3]
MRPAVSEAACPPVLCVRLPVHACWPPQESPAGKSSAKESAEATLSMFKRGGRIQTRPKPGETAAAAAAAASGGSSSGPAGGQRKAVGSRLEQLTAGLERKVANCLSCGKIYDCRSLTNDIIAFINGRCACTFCGAQVAMTQQQRIAQAQQPQHNSSSSSSITDTAAAAAGGAGSAAAADDDDATAKAIAFKDRLVDYDRHSQKRTTVIDDQSDYFEIDTNAWLSEEERAELKRRAEAEEAAAAARRNRVTVTLDLLGRKVLMAEGPDGSAAGGSSGASFQTMSASEALRQGVDVAAAAGGAGPGAAAAAAGGDAAQAQQQQQQQGSGQTEKKQRQRSHKGKQQQQQQQQQGPAGSSSQPKQQGQGSSGVQRRGGAAARAAAADARVQDDSIFTEFEAELLIDERLADSGGRSNPKQQQRA